MEVQDERMEVQEDKGDLEGWQTQQLMMEAISQKEEGRGTEG